MDSISKHNRVAWDREVEQKNPATIPTSSEEITRTLEGARDLSMTGRRLIPTSWLDTVPNSDVLALGCGGGQQVPLLAAMDGRVTSFENSPAQLARDVDTCKAHGLSVSPILGDIRDLSVLPSASFDSVWIGLCLQFIPDITSVWEHVARVTRPRAQVVVAFVDPINYIFDLEEYAKNRLIARHSLPYSDLLSLTDEERAAQIDPEDPFEFSHTLEDYLGRWAEHGFSIAGFMQDNEKRNELCSTFFSTYSVVCARREA